MIKFFFSTGKFRLRVILFIYSISCLFIVYYSIPEASSGIKKYRGPDCEASDRVLVFKKELVVIVDISSNSSLSKMEHQCYKMGRACAKLAH